MIEVFMEGSLLVLGLTALVAGLGLSFTPCNWPMYPILGGIIASSKAKMGTSKGFWLAAAYVAGMAVIYAVIGALAGFLGESIVPYLQHPYILYACSLITLIFALSFFGLYEIKMPQRMQDSLITVSDHQEGGTYLGVFIMGALATLILSPCVTPFFGYAILYILLVGNVVKGAVALALFGVGMGVPLLVLGALGGKIMPKSGNWMHKVKFLIGLVLVFLSIFLFIRGISQNPAGYSAEQPQMLYFSATWCGYCHKFQKEVLQSYDTKRELRRFNVRHIDIDERPDLKRKYHVSGVPTVVFMKNGRELLMKRVIGYVNKSKFIRILKSI